MRGVRHAVCRERMGGKMLAPLENKTMWYTYIKNRLRQFLSLTLLEKNSLTGRAWCKEHQSCPDFAPIISRVLNP